MKNKKTPPFQWGLLLASLVSCFWILGASFLGVVDFNRFIAILILQFALHFLIGYFCVKFGQKYGYLNPIYLFWLAFSLNHLQVYGLGNMIPVCQPSQVAFSNLDFVLVAELLPQANIFVLLAYLLSAFMFEILITYVPTEVNKINIIQWLSSPMTFYFAVSATVALVMASYRIGPYYNSSIGLDEGGENILFNNVSSVEKIFYYSTFLFTYTPVLILAIYAILVPAKSRFKYIITCIVAALLAIFSFTIFRQRSYAILSTLSALLPFIYMKKTRKASLVLMPLLLVVAYFFVTAFRGGAIDSLGDNFDLAAYFSSANTDVDSLSQTGANDVSYNRAGLNPLTVLINLQNSGKVVYHSGLQFITELLVGLPENLRIYLPEDFLISTKERLAEIYNQRVDFVSSPYAPFAYDYPWLIGPFVSVIGFTVIFFIYLTVIKFLNRYNQTLGGLYIPYFNVVMLSSGYSSYLVCLKVMFPWVILLAVTKLALKGGFKKVAQ